VNPRFERNTPRSLHQPDPAELGRVVVVLVGTSHPGNVGSAARALRNMGLSHLRLVNPRFVDIASQPEALAFASGADAVLQAATVHAQLDDAIADCALAVAVSAEPREFSALPLTPEAACDQVLQVLRSHAEHRVALIFGAERTGLSIEQVQRCGVLLSIPGHPHYNSLNLAQAVQIVAYVLRRQALPARHTTTADRTLTPETAGEPDAAGARAFQDSKPDLGTPLDAPVHSRLADQQAIQGLLEHLERMLVAVEFLDPQTPRKLMPRLSRFMHRARPTTEEVDLLRGICKAVLARKSDGTGRIN